MLPQDHIESLKRIESGYWWFVGKKGWITSYVKEWLPRPSASIAYLDVGCGTGGLAYRVKCELGIGRLALADSHPVVSEEIQRDQTVTVLALAVDQIDPAQFSFDLITCCDVIEHIKETIPVLQHLKKLLKPNGKMILTVPAFSVLYSDWDRHLGHHRRYRREGLRRELEAAGFEVEEITYFWAPLFLVGWFRKFKKRTAKEMEFPPTPKWLNGALIVWSRFEYTLSRLIRLPFGTSLIVRVSSAG